MENLTNNGEFDEHMNKLSEMPEKRLIEKGNDIDRRYRDYVENGGF